jgi:hypothetical protein
MQPRGAGEDEEIAVAAVDGRMPRRKEEVVVVARCRKGAAFLHLLS